MDDGPLDTPEQIASETYKWLTRKPNVYGKPGKPFEEHEEVLDLAEIRVLEGVVTMPQYQKDAEFIGENAARHERALNLFRNPAFVKHLKDVMDVRRVRVLDHEISMHVLQEPSVDYDHRPEIPNNVDPDRFKEEALLAMFEVAEYPTGWGKIWIKASDETLSEKTAGAVAHDLIDAQEFWPDIILRDCSFYLLLMQRDGRSIDELIRYNDEARENQILFDMTKKDDE